MLLFGRSFVKGLNWFEMPRSSRCSQKWLSTSCSEGFILRLDLRQGYVRVSLRAASITPCPLPFPSQSTQHAAGRSIHNKDVLELPYYYVPRTRSYQGENLPKCLRESRVSVKLFDIGHQTRYPWEGRGVRCQKKIFPLFSRPRAELATV